MSLILAILLLTVILGGVYWVIGLLFGRNVLSVLQAVICTLAAAYAFAHGNTGTGLLCLVCALYVAIGYTVRRKADESKPG